MFSGSIGTISHRRAYPHRKLPTEKLVCPRIVQKRNSCSITRAKKLKVSTARESFEKNLPKKLFSHRIFNGSAAPPKTMIFGQTNVNCE
jgi:hypothetical protein